MGIPEGLAAATADQRLKIEMAKSILRVALMHPEKMDLAESIQEALNELEDVTTVAIAIKEVPVVVEVTGYELTGFTAELSKREREVLQLMADGLKNAEIGQKLGLSPETIKNHAQRIFDKLSVRNRTEAVTKAMSLGVLARRTERHDEPDLRLGS